MEASSERNSMKSWSLLSQTRSTMKCRIWSSAPAWASAGGVAAFRGEVASAPEGLLAAPSWLLVRKVASHAFTTSARCSAELAKCFWKRSANRGHGGAQCSFSCRPLPTSQRKTPPRLPTVPM